ncbi:transcriptional regulator MraZ [Antarctobacter heliothermus]|uniref:Transcriptional regulator MraZ n=1 Tax=Antarctobacter heliothermus TaxID=74033 RepID=A0A222E9J7_9RHOB|nr:cell division/cell wall cluster transcriptional repressor MraZ [Antarctobacter heliothermus]ASP22883.1 transcriptional regulator MraZ [Antarctobacter heliothermus]|tara:strand:+ start:65 stop:517 length:453 start_codon:yes stop_codon:yes gene_type:complete
MSIPASFRRVLAAGDPDWDPESKDNANPSLVMVTGDPRQKCLEVYTIEEIERIEARIEKLKAGPDKQALTAIYSSGATPATVDETGRLVLSARFRTRFGIGAEAWAVASLNKFQIWSADRYTPTDAIEEDELAVDLPEDPMELLDALEGL